jgi:hypothetical protein
MFQRVSVWLDALAPDAGAFAHALEWASRLGLPLRGVLAAPGRNPRQAKGEAETGKRRPEPDAEVAVLRTCEAACARAGIPWSVCVCEGAPALWAREFLSPLELCLFGHSLPGDLRTAFLRTSRQQKHTAALVCSANWHPLSRVLVLNQGRDPGNAFLASAAQICRAFRVTPVVLTVARSEWEAHLRQAFAQNMFTRAGLGGDFDLVIGCEVGAAVALEAQCRRCSHVFLEKPSTPPWWRWLRGDALQRLLGLSEALTFLTLPRTPVGSASGEASPPGLRSGPSVRCDRVSV